MPSLDLRPLQVELLDKLSEAFRTGHRNVMVCAPCAFGKTEIATAMLLKTRENGKRGAFICDRISLIDQTSERFDRYGLDHGIRQASHWRHRPGEPIQLCTIQTLIRRRFPDAELNIYDEAHELSKGAKEQLLKRQGYSVGLSATPMTRGLGKYFDTIITAATTNQLIEHQLLVPFKTFAHKEPDLSGVKIVAGEYDETETEKRSMPVVGDVVAEYIKHGGERAFICFAVSVAHAEELQRQFMAAGIIAEPYHYRRTNEENAETLRSFKNGNHIQGLISINSLTRAFDDTHVEVMICARPLRRALHVFIQMIGRVLRVHPGKSEALLLDHSGNAIRFWPELQEYLAEGVNELDDGKPKTKTANEKKERKPVKCPKCSHVFAGGSHCPSCGYIFPPKKSIEHEAGELRQFDGNGILKMDRAAKTQLYGELLHVALERRYKIGWVAWKYKSATGVWPRGVETAPIKPSEATLQFIDAERRKREWHKTVSRKSQEVDLFA